MWCEECKKPGEWFRPNGTLKISHIHDSSSASTAFCYSTRALISFTQMYHKRVNHSRKQPQSLMMISDCSVCLILGLREGKVISPALLAIRIH